MKRSPGSERIWGGRGPRRMGVARAPDIEVDPNERPVSTSEVSGHRSEAARGGVRVDTEPHSVPRLIMVADRSVRHRATERLERAA